MIKGSTVERIFVMSEKISKPNQDVYTMYIHQENK